MKKLKNILKNKGISNTDTLLVHSSYSNLARENVNVKSLINELLETVNMGNLLIPTMSWRYVNKTQNIFDLKNTPSNTGYISEVFRKDYSQFRSYHPTHSICGYGKNVKDISNEHHLSKSPCDLKSPFYKMLKYNPWILLMNTKIDCCTNIHSCEEQVAPNLYIEESPIEYKIKISPQEILNYKCLKHKLLKRNYYKVQDLLDVNNQITFFKLFSTVNILFRADSLNNLVLKELKKDSYFLLANNFDKYRLM